MSGVTKEGGSRTQENEEELGSTFSGTKNTNNGEESSVTMKSGTGEAESTDTANKISKTIATKLGISEFSKPKQSDITKAKGVSSVTQSVTMVSNGKQVEEGSTDDKSDRKGVIESQRVGVKMKKGMIKTRERIKKKEKNEVVEEKTKTRRRKRMINGEDENQSQSTINLMHLQNLIHNISYYISRALFHT